MRLTYERLHEVLHYNPESGNWTWAISKPGRGCIKGTRAGTVKGNGYNYVTIDYCAYLSSRAAVLYMTGEWPEHEVDHKNLIKTDDRWKNLRAAARGENAANVPAHADNSCGLKGVKKCRDKWQARIMVRGVNIHLGSFCSPKDANAAYAGAAARYFGNFARS